MVELGSASRQLESPQELGEDSRQLRGRHGAMVELGSASRQLGSPDELGEDSRQLRGRHGQAQAQEAASPAKSGLCSSRGPRQRGKAPQWPGLRP
eukprot:12297576-Alexandrium_andersonii.AAC.1